MQRQGRHLERSGSKRVLNHHGGGGDEDDDERAPKRPRVPALARLAIDCCQWLVQFVRCPSAAY
jgi:hypothetical protein